MFKQVVVSYKTQDDNLWGYLTWNYYLLPLWGNGGEIWGQTSQSKGFTKLLLSDVVLCSHITTNVHLASALLVLLVQRTKWQGTLSINSVSQR